MTPPPTLICRCIQESQLESSGRGCHIHYTDLKSSCMLCAIHEPYLKAPHVLCFVIYAQLQTRHHAEAFVLNAGLQPPAIYCPVAAPKLDEGRAISRISDGRNLETVGIPCPAVGRNLQYVSLIAAHRKWKGHIGASVPSPCRHGDAYGH